MFCQLILPRFIVPTLSPFKVPRPLVTYFRHLNSSIMNGEDINLSVIESAKRLAAIQAIDQNVQDQQVIGIGSGSTIVYAVQRLKERVVSEGLSVVCIPTSFQAENLIRDNGLVLSDLETNPVLDIAFDGADEVDVNTKYLIKGGGACHLQEKVVACASRSKLIVIADDRKFSSALGTKWTSGIPIAVVPKYRTFVSKKIEEMFGGKVNLRQAIRKAGPVVTDDGHFVLDWIFDPKLDHDWPQVDRGLHSIPGLVETGLFIGLANKVFIGNSDGSVTVID